MLVLGMFHMRKLAFYTDLWAEIQSFSCVIYAVLGNSRKHPFAHSPHSHHGLTSVVARKCRVVQPIPRWCAPQYCTYGA